MCEAILFPGYVFFDTKDVQQLYYRLKKVSGLTKILATGNEFTPLHETEIAFLKQFGGKKHIVKMSYLNDLIIHKKSRGFPCFLS